MSPSTDLIRETLWGISNITASTLSHIAAFLGEEMLLNRVLVLMTHSNCGLKTEAIYVICNLINSPWIEPDWLRELYDKKGFAIVQPLCKALEDKNLDADILICTLRSLAVLLELDQSFKETLFGFDSVRFSIESHGGFNMIEELLNHKNQEV